MDGIMTNMNQLAEGGIDQGISQIRNAAGHNMTALVIAAVIGLAVCFFGLKLIRVLAAVSGLVIGAAVGVAAAQALHLNGVAFGAVAVVAGVIVAVLASLFLRVGVFLWALMMGAGVSAVFLVPDTMVKLVICLAVGLLTAVFSTIFMEPLSIVFTSVYGSLAAGFSILTLAGRNDNVLITTVSVAVLAVLGMAVQFMMRSRELGRKEKVHAKAFKEKASREAEVEKARMLLNDDDETADSSNSSEPEDEDDDIRFID